MGRRVTSVAEISAAVEAGDSQAGQVLYETGYYLGMGISNIVNSFNPDVIVLAGGVAGAGEHLLRGVRDAVRELSLPPAAEQTRIEVSTQGEWAGVVGGSCLVWEAAPV
jgi:predicted NBD/HSP70 family sugar kinase